MPLRQRVPGLVALRHGVMIMLRRQQLDLAVLTYADAGLRRIESATADALPGDDGFGHSWFTRCGWRSLGERSSHLACSPGAAS